MAIIEHLIIGGTTYDLSSGGSSDLPEISTQNIYLYTHGSDIIPSTGLYRLTYNGNIYIYYNQNSTNSYITILKNSILQIEAQSNSYSIFKIWSKSSDSSDIIREYCGNSYNDGNRRHNGAFTCVTYGPKANSMAIGTMNSAAGANSFAHGNGVNASSNNQVAFGTYNEIDANNTYIEVVGNGGSGITRSNARTLDWNGNEVLKGKLYIEKTGNNKKMVAVVPQAQVAGQYSSATSSYDFDDISLDDLKSGNATMNMVLSHTGSPDDVYKIILPTDNMQPNKKYHVTGSYLNTLCEPVSGDIIYYFQYDVGSSTIGTLNVQAGNNTTSTISNNDIIWTGPDVNQFWQSTRSWTVYIDYAAASGE